MKNIVWRISGTSVQGLHHIDKNIPCQDKIFSLKNEADGITAIALADGAGSAAMSHYGADKAVKVICEKLCENFNKFINSEDPGAVGDFLIKAILAQLDILSQELNCKLESLASTLLAAASDGENILLAHLGDGVIGCFKDGKIIPASLPENGEFKNETFFTTSPYAERRIRLIKDKIAGISGIVLMSDGAADVLYNSQNKKFASLLDEIKKNCLIYSAEDNNIALDNLFNNIKYKTHDDCSMIIMCRPDEYFRGYRDLDENAQNYFLGAKNLAGKENREKIFSILAQADGEALSSSVIIKSACKLGLKRRQASGLIKDLCKNGFIEYVKIFPRKRYKLKFLY